MRLVRWQSCTPIVSALLALWKALYSCHAHVRIVLWRVIVVLLLLLLHSHLLSILLVTTTIIWLRVARWTVGCIVGGRLPLCLPLLCSHVCMRGVALIPLISTPTLLVTTTVISVAAVAPAGVMILLSRCSMILTAAT